MNALVTKAYFFYFSVFTLSISIFNQFYPIFYLPLLLLILFFSPFYLTTRYEGIILTLGSIAHLTLLLTELDTKMGFLENSIESLFLVLSMYLVFFIGLKLLQRSKVQIPSWLITTVVFICIFIIGGMEKINPLNLGSNKFSWLVSYLLWPFLLSVNDIHQSNGKSIGNTELIFSLCPLWFVRLFHNIPTHHGPLEIQNSLRGDKLTRLKLQKKAAQQMGFTAFLISVSEFFKWIAYGGRLFKIENSAFAPSFIFRPPWQLTPIIEWNLNISASAYFFSAVVVVLNMFLYFIIISMAANSVALFLGFNLTLNEQVGSGLKMARSWNLVMHYLNYIAKTVFFAPAVNGFKFIKNRKHRNMTAAILAIYAFGTCYLAFIPYGGAFKDGHWSERFYYRYLYLILIVLIAGLRIYGPRLKDNKWHSLLLRLFIAISFILIMSMGLLSLSLVN